MHDMHDMHDMHNMHNTHDTPPHKQFYQYGTPLRERFNSVYRQGCGRRR